MHIFIAKNVIEKCKIKLKPEILPANAEVTLEDDENAADYFRINTIALLMFLNIAVKTAFNV